MLPKASGICAHCQRYTQMLPPRLNFRYDQLNYSSGTYYPMIYKNRTYFSLSALLLIRLVQPVADNLLSNSDFSTIIRKKISENIYDNLIIF